MAGEVRSAAVETHHTGSRRVGADSVTFPTYCSLQLPWQVDQNRRGTRCISVLSRIEKPACSSLVYLLCRYLCCDSFMINIKL